MDGCLLCGCSYHPCLHFSLHATGNPTWFVLCLTLSINCLQLRQVVPRARQMGSYNSLNSWMD